MSLQTTDLDQRGFLPNGDIMFGLPRAQCSVRSPCPCTLWSLDPDEESHAQSGLGHPGTVDGAFPTLVGLECLVTGVVPMKC